MKEKLMQDYIFSNPEYLFPGKTISKQQKEHYIEGKRIDLFFIVESINYIIELKAIPLNKEHIGQVIEYYGLMKTKHPHGDFRMILVSPSILPWRRIYLEEIGIQCVEFDVAALDVHKEAINKNDVVASKKKAEKVLKITSELPDGTKFEKSRLVESGPHPIDVSLVTNTRQLIFSQVAKIFNELEPQSFGIMKSASLDYDYEYINKKHGVDAFTKGKAWFAFQFGNDKNDKPNISIIFYPNSCDITVNAELQHSQSILLDKCSHATMSFDNLLLEHGNLYFKSYLKFEHQPRGYHWILDRFDAPGEYSSSSIVEHYNDIRKNYSNIRQKYIDFITHKNTVLSASQKKHLSLRSINLNFAMRLVDPIDLSCDFWNLNYTQQANYYLEKISKLKNIIYFLTT